uniref:PROBABLE SIGNAL PEPTIDE PROTEIN n=1 Tax=uncultured Thiotrichaceae bacterium TaxID=298394 RepID=A0A6S6TTT9_9GAMM|nr:MAG: PROBABLE SIGNAL PEPTIDE PROTEIN [uncultured Thiotrichaceae bacterium]
MIIKDYKSARHLSSRLEIGVDDELTKARVGLHVADVLGSMIPSEEIIPPKLSLTAWSEVSDFYEYSRDMQLEMHLDAKIEAREITSWWLETIYQTEYPLLERMTIFWHGHFTSNATDVVWPQFVYRQNQLFRRHALGNFSDLLYEITRDPAMLIYLDLQVNVKDNPNENFARELLELFTLGEGNYSEDDIVNAARAFTGWGLDFEVGEFEFRKNYHDNDDKTFLGHEGNLNGDDIVAILLNDPNTAEFIAKKFWAEFINHDEPDQSEVERWATAFRDSGYEIKALLNEVIHSAAFWREENKAVMIKSPVEFSVGMMRELGLELESYTVLRKANEQLGQDLLYPPDVKGWRGGDQWITNTRLVRRYDLISNLMLEHTEGESNLEELVRSRVSSTELAGGMISMFRRLMDRLSCSTNSDQLIQWLLAETPTSQPNCEASLLGMLYVFLRDPTYQLK